MSEHATHVADPRQSPRFAGVATFCRYPLLELVPEANRPVDWAIYGFPFDAGVTYRPGARFGPRAIREASQYVKPYHIEHDLDVTELRSLADAGDAPSSCSRAERVETNSNLVACHGCAPSGARSSNSFNNVFCAGDSNSPLMGATAARSASVMGLETPSRSDRAAPTLWIASASLKPSISTRKKSACATISSAASASRRQPSVKSTACCSNSLSQSCANKLSPSPSAGAIVKPSLARAPDSHNASWHGMNPLITSVASATARSGAVSAASITSRSVLAFVAATIRSPISAMCSRTFRA